MTASKKRRVGADERLSLLRQIDPESDAIVGNALGQFSRREVAKDCWQSAQVGQIRTREDYYYEELRGSSLRVLL